MKRISRLGIFALSCAVAAIPVVASARQVGMVYTMTNASSGNAVLGFGRDDMGNLVFSKAYATGGRGAGAALDSSGAIALSSDNRFLFVVNAGSNDISVFGVAPDGALHLIDRAPSGGSFPISVTSSRHRLYVLNAGGDIGGTDDISGFTVELNGHIAPLAKSTRPLSAPQTKPAEIRFSRDGGVLTVTEQSTNNIDTYEVGSNGVAHGPAVHASAAQTPFGFAFDLSDRLIVSDAVGGGQNASGASSYALVPNNGLNAITPFAPTNQTAACWVAISADGTTAFLSNTGSGTISGFRITFKGMLNPLNNGQPLAPTGPPTSGPTDLAQSADGRFLYSLDGGLGAISAFAERGGGRLAGQFGVSGLPLSASGLAAI